MDDDIAIVSAVLPVGDQSVATGERGADVIENVLIRKLVPAPVVWRLRRHHGVTREAVAWYSAPLRSNDKFGYEPRALSTRSTNL
jgi:hypothetical protein